jgi:membrane-associated phospholipid phosphatase
MKHRALLLLLAAGAATATGCDQQPTAALGDATASAKIVRPLASLTWNQIARDLVVANKSTSTLAFRGFALVSVAQYNSMVAAAGERVPARNAGAASAASVAVLTYLYPAAAASLEAQLIAQQATWGTEGAARFASGEAIGRNVAAGIIARAQTDGFNAVWTGTVPVCPGCWVSATPPVFPLLGSATPFFLESGSQFRPGPPPAFGSETYLAALAEVRQISDTRTVEQDSIAKFWAFATGTVTPGGYWNIVAADLLVRHHRNDLQAAHTLALMNMAQYDAIIANHEAKYTYWFIRPVQADPLIVLSIALPSHPSYPSNHSAISAASTTVLGAFFPDQRATLDAMADQAAMSRLFAGIHYRFDDDAGLVLGRQVGQFALGQDVLEGKPFVLK